MLIKRAQSIFETTEPIQSDMKQLNLVKNHNEIYQYQGIIQGDYPIYIPRNSKLAEIVQHFHKKTFHGGIVLTMTAVRDQYWIPKLRHLTKIIIRNCYGCKRYHIKPYDTPLPGQPTKYRRTGIRAFQVTGLDFARPVMYNKGNFKQNKLYTYCYSHAVLVEQFI